MKISILVFFSCFITILTNAQPFTLNKNIKPVELKLVPYKAKDSIWNGKINITTVAQKEDTLYYFVKGLSIYQPIYISIASQNPKHKYEIKLCKDNWKSADRTAKLDAKGNWGMQFKTEGSFGLMVVCKEPLTNYKLLVWVGKELKNIGIPSPFTKK
ncbi:MAG: hypothetical protein IPP48_16420 [Chitinophagaceae bacterium]|nr:hypothetical protein [Chitinophagaceae bacterium]